MANFILKWLHLFLISYGLYGGFLYYEEQEERLVNAKEQAESLEPRIRKIERDLKSVKKFQENLEESKRRVIEVVEEIKKVQKQLPSDIKDTEVTGKITTFADELKMVNPDATPKGEKDNKFYFSKEYNFDAQGTFLQALIFYEKLEKMSRNDRILNVTYLRMKNSEDSDPRSRFKIIDLSTTIEAYRYNDRYDATKDVKQ